MCERTKRNGEPCPKEWAFMVNGRYREAQQLVCASHLASAVRDLSTFNDPRYKRRHPDDKHAGTVYPRPTMDTVRPK